MIVFVITFIGLWGPVYLLFGPKHGPYKFLSGAVVGLELVFAFAYVVGSINDSTTAQAQPPSIFDTPPSPNLFAGTDDRRKPFIHVPADGNCPRDYVFMPALPACALYIPPEERPGYVPPPSYPRQDDSAWTSAYKPESGQPCRTGYMDTGGTDFMRMCIIIPPGPRP